MWMARMARALPYTPWGRYFAARYTGMREVCQSLATNIMSWPYLVLGTDDSACTTASISAMAAAVGPEPLAALAAAAAAASAAARAVGLRGGSCCYGCEGGWRGQMQWSG